MIQGLHSTLFLKVNAPNKLFIMTNNGNNRNYSSGKNNNSTSKNSGGNSSEYKPLKKTFADHFYFNGSAKEAADYQTTTDYIINHITKTFEFGSDIVGLNVSRDIAFSAVYFT
jgi:hypothetical protein